MRCPECNGVDSEHKPECVIDPVNQLAAERAAHAATREDRDVRESFLTACVKREVERAEKAEAALGEYEDIWGPRLAKAEADRDAARADAAALRGAAREYAAEWAPRGHDTEEYPEVERLRSLLAQGIRLNPRS